MKKCLFLMLMMVSVCAMGQEANFAKRENGLLLLSNVETVSNVSASELYRRALLWVTDVYKNPKAVIQTQDADAGILVVMGNIYGAAKTRLKHKLTMEFKDGRYRWTISDIQTIFPSMFNMPDKPAEDTPRYNKETEEKSLGNLNDDFLDYIVSFKNKLSEGDDW